METACRFPFVACNMNNPNALAHPGYFFVNGVACMPTLSMNSGVTYMQINPLKHLLMVASLLLAVNFSYAAEHKAVPASSAVATTRPPATPSKKVDAKPATTAKVRLVDINNAGRNELKTLPDVTDAIADKIIAGRPFGSKAQLTTRGIVPRDVYENLKNLIIAKQNAGTTAKLLGK